MAPDAIVFAMANPNPEVHPEVAAPVRRGRGDRRSRTSRTRSTTCWRSPASSAGRFDVRATADHRGHEDRRGRTRWPAWSGDDLAEDYVIPSPFDPRVGPAVAAAVSAAARADGVARR